MMSNLLNGITGILVAIAPNYSSVLVFRMLYGFGVKSGWTVGYVMGTGAVTHSLVLASPSAFTNAEPLPDSHRDGRRGVQAHGGGGLPDVLQRGAPHPPPPRLLHH